MSSLQLKLERWQRIYVNRSLNMRSIKAIGFDMDHTLVMYNRVEFETLAFKETLKKLVNVGYPEELLTLEFKPTFLIRGLLVDIERGNILKVDGHKYVKIAFHGSEKLSKETRHALYNKSSFRANEFVSVDTFFALSEVQLFAEIVNFMDRNETKIQKSYKEVYADIRKFIDLSHADGTIKSKVVADPTRFINKDKHLATSLIRFKDANKYLFLLTNSQWQYTSDVMSMILDGEHEDFESWRDYFDCVIVAAGKPGFFTGSQPFYEVMTDTHLLKPHSGILQSGHVYQGGSAAFFQDLTKFRGDEILYVGDHIFGDIMQSKGMFNWRTCLVVEEMEEELKKIDKDRKALENIRERMYEKEILDEECQIVRSKLASMTRHIQKAILAKDEKKAEFLEKERKKVEEKMRVKEEELSSLSEHIKVKVKEYELRMHPVWGELMKVGLERSRIAYQVESFACVYSSRASNFRFYSPNKKFQSFHDILPHDVR